MSLGLIKAANNAEMSDELHLTRLLFLLNEADHRSGKTIEGIMKLAKLDFLLRYPNCLERLLIQMKRDIKKADIKPYERTTIESKMIRFRYGPWDERYRRWIELLVSKGLAIAFKRGRTIHIGLTDKGRDLINQLSTIQGFADLQIRSNEIYKAVGDKGATALKDLIYKTFPEIVDMKWGEEIKI